jgi:molybdopterin-guanine dinucleotide biosynthesis protein A
MIEEGNYAVHDLFPKFHTRFLRLVPGDEGHHPHMFMNVNRPEDLKRTLSILDEG